MAEARGEPAAGRVRRALTGQRRAVLFDLGGTLGDQGATGIQDFEPFHTAAPAIRTVNRTGFRAIVITNQSRIQRGQFTSREFGRFVTELIDELAGEGATIHDVYHCPHTAEHGCECRKPAPGLLLSSAPDHQIDLSSSFLIVDVGAWDIVSARRAGCAGVLVRTGWGEGSLGEFRNLWAGHEADCQ